MFTPILGFDERAIVGVYKVASVASSGLAMMALASDTTPLTPSPYGNSYGTVQPATITTAGVLRETGWLLQPVTASGPSVFSILASIYDESVPAGTVAGVVLSKSGCQIATDQYATGTGAITFAGSVALDATCGINAGQPRTLQTGDVARLLFKGQVVQRTLPLGLFEII
jgi:hypothetical protein